MSALCYIYIDSNYRTRLSKIYCFFLNSAEGKERIKVISIQVQIFHKEGEQLENYTKYKLKSSDELTSVLSGRDNLFVIACNKCFKEFETVDEPDCGEFLKFAAEQGKTVTGSAKFDFLCNKMHTERKLQDLLPEGTENVVVISCVLVSRQLRIWQASR